MTEDADHSFRDYTPVRVIEAVCKAHETRLVPRTGVFRLPGSWGGRNVLILIAPSTYTIKRAKASRITAYDPIVQIRTIAPQRSHTSIAVYVGSAHHGRIVLIGLDPAEVTHK